MNSSAVPVRLSPLPPADRAPDVAELLSADGPFPVAADSNWFATLAHNPGLFRKFAPFASKLIFAGKLSGRDREILILRTAWRCRASYEWLHHLTAAREAGIPEQLLTQLARANPDIRDTGDVLLVTSADELVSGHTLSDETWSQLAERYSKSQLVEIPFLVGCYAMVAGAMNSFGVAIEDAAESGTIPGEW